MDDEEQERSKAMASSITLGGAASALLQAFAGDPKHRGADEDALKELNHHGMLEGRDADYHVTPRGETYLKEIKPRG